MALAHLGNVSQLSEDALRQLSKSLTEHVPDNVNSLDEDEFAYGSAARLKKTTDALQGTFSSCCKKSYKLLAQGAFLLPMALPP